ncbi:MAG: hypothetical protein JXA20_15880 [Spirochaetes bacterium]|nr:hypothetical protein [Spirochaetota bacterium]
MNDTGSSGLLYRKTPLSYGMEGMAVGFMLVMGLFCLFLAGSCLYVLGVHLGLLSQRGVDNLLSAGKAVAATLVTGALFLLLLYRVAVRLLDWILAPRGLEGSVTGKREVAPSGLRRSLHRYLTVGETVFDTNKRSFDSVEAGMKVRVTYTRRRKQIQRIERIP